MVEADAEVETLQRATDREQAKARRVENQDQCREAIQAPAEQERHQVPPAATVK